MGEHLVWLVKHLPDLVHQLHPRLRSPSPYNTAIEFLDRWQTLISGGAAILAAAVTVFFLSRQVDIEEQRDRAARKRAEREARLTVTPALSPLSVYVDEMFLYWARNDPNQPVPTVPDASVKALMKASLNTDDETFQSIRELVTWVQVFDARATGFLRRDAKPPLNWREVLISDLMYLSCLINPLYQFGRDQVSAVPFREPTTEDMLKAIPLMWRLGFSSDAEERMKNEIRSAVKTYYGGKN